MRALLFVLIVKLFAEAADADCGVVPIEQWAGVTSRREEVLRTPVSLVVIQHTVSQECVTDIECEKYVRAIQQYHLSRGFSDIAQSFLIGGNGKIYEGAGWQRVGAHTRFYNNRSIGIAFIGDFREKLPTPEALKAAQDLLNCGVENKHLSENYRLVGHVQLSPTQSPGATLQNHIKTWQHWVANAK